MTFEEKLKKYAKLIVEVGVNIQKGQYLMINSPIEGAYFARELATCAYEAGAKRVYVDYQDEELTKITYTYASEEALEEYPKWKADANTSLAEKGAAFISISASNPDLLKDIDPNKITVAQKAANKALAKYRRYISNSDVPWCVASIPTIGWAKKVFLDMDEQKALEALWEKIFEVNRMNEEDPVKAWKEHTESLERRTKYLNNKKIKELHYKASGTDLKVTLPKDHIWLGGGEYSRKGIYFVANLPTEEAYTVPYKYGVEGKLTATKPLSYAGNLIENFTLYFEKGKVVDYTAEKGYEILKKLIETDEGSCYLGEVAIVPHSSPVSASNIIFFNTLFDENASCHFALGSCYPTNIKGGEKMTDEDLEKVGLNTSLIHIDFMVGAADMHIEAVDDSDNTFDIIKDGEWCI